MNRRTVKIIRNNHTDNELNERVKRNLETYIRGKKALYIRPSDKYPGNASSPILKCLFYMDFNVNLDGDPIYLAYDPIIDCDAMTLTFTDSDTNPLPKEYIIELCIGNVLVDSGLLDKTDYTQVLNTVRFIYHKPKDKK